MAISIPLNLKYSKSYSMCCPANPSDAHLKLVFGSEKGSIFLKSSDLEKYRRFALHHSCDGGGPITRLGPESSPLLVELEPICDESHFDAVVGEARSPQEPVVVLWLANWCRKCIYLKPKLERLAADYYPRVRFYSIDVNKVPHRLVVRAGVTKMPTIQLWRDGRKQSEVIGGQKAHLVVSEVHEMIESQYDSI